MVHSANGLKVCAAILALATVSLGCGRKEKGEDAGAGVAPVDEGTDDASKVPKDVGVGPDKVQLGDEAIGLKNNEQIVAHYGLATGSAYATLEPNVKEDLRRLMASMPTDNDAGKFNAAHALTIAKTATLFCDRFLRREETARTDPAAGVEPRLPDLDFVSQKPLPKELARPIYDAMTSVFWGEDIANLPSDAAVQAALDPLVDALSVQPADPALPRIGLRGTVLGICVAVATSFPAIEL